MGISRGFHHSPTSWPKPKACRPQNAPHTSLIVIGAFWGARDSSLRAFMIQSRHDLAWWFQQAPVLEGPARAGLGSGRQDRSTGARGRAAAPRQQQPARQQPSPEGRDRPAQEPAAAPAVQTLRHGESHPAAARRSGPAPRPRRQTGSGDPRGDAPGRGSTRLALQRLQDGGAAGSGAGRRGRALQAGTLGHAGGPDHHRAAAGRRSRAGTDPACGGSASPCTRKAR